MVIIINGYFGGLIVSLFCNMSKFLVSDTIFAAEHGKQHKKHTASVMQYAMKIFFMVVVFLKNILYIIYDVSTPPPTGSRKNLLHHNVVWQRSERDFCM
jgi:hypothetical protein